MAKKNIILMLILIGLFIAGVTTKMSLGESPLLGNILLIVGLLGFLLMILSNLVMHRKKNKHG